MGAPRKSQSGNRSLGNLPPEAVSDERRPRTRRNPARRAIVSIYGRDVSYLNVRERGAEKTVMPPGDRGESEAA